MIGTKGRGRKIVRDRGECGGGGGEGGVKVKKEDGRTGGRHDEETMEFLHKIRNLVWHQDPPSKKKSCWKMTCFWYSNREIFVWIPKANGNMTTRSTVKNFHVEDDLIFIFKTSRINGAHSQGC
jgi:hypothetical protein